MRVLIVDDERAARLLLVRILSALEDVDIREAGTIDEARAELAAGDIDVALIDMRLARDTRNRDGLALVGETRARTTTVPIVVTAAHDMAEVRAAMRLGAYDYIFKDELSAEMVLPILRGLRSTRALEREVIGLRIRQGADATLGLVGTSPPMQRLREMIQRVALSDRPALITGPTGSGKELVVRAIHALGRDPSQPLLDINCGAFPATLIESQLFGHERGAFTGADRRRDGFFTAVGSGTLFLDEIAELPFDLQAKLLRVLETNSFRPVGSSTTLKFRGRLVAATHADLEASVAKGQFREDLYYRLNVLEVMTPSLEERRGDIPALVAHFAATQERPLHFTAETMEILQLAPWPGNVRQLRNFIDRVAVFAQDAPITPAVLASLTRQQKARDASGRPVDELARAILSLPEGTDKLQMMEHVLIDEALRLSDGNRTAASRLLGVHRKVVSRRADRGEPRSADDDDESVPKRASASPPKEAPAPK